MSVLSVVQFDFDAQFIINALALLLSVLLVALYYRLTLLYKKQNETSKRILGAQTIGARYEFHDSLYESIDERLVKLAQDHPKPWVEETSDVAENADLMGRYLSIARLSDTYNYVYQYHREGLVSDSEWDSYLVWLDDWKGYWLFDELIKHWYEDYAANSSKLDEMIDNPELYRPRVTDADQKLIEATKPGESSFFFRCVPAVLRRTKPGASYNDLEETVSDSESELEAEKIAINRIRMLVDKGVLEATDGITIKDAQYHLTEFGERINDNRETIENEFTLLSLLSDEADDSDTKKPPCYFDQLMV